MPSSSSDVTTVLSLQSDVTYGHVGNSAAVFALRRLGVEAWPVATVRFSDHTGYGRWRGSAAEPAEVAAIVAGLDELGVLGQVSAVLTGYLGTPELARVIVETVDLVRERNPHALFCCDPVMGDTARGYFVRPGVPEAMRGLLVPRAQLITPNHFELDALTGRTTRTVEDVLEAADDLRATGPGLVLVTSVIVTDTPPETLSMVAVSAAGAWMVSVPRVARSFSGAGDLTAAVFLAHHLRSGAAEALRLTASAVHGVIEATLASGRAELALVAAQRQLEAPSRRFPVVRLG